MPWRPFRRDPVPVPLVLYTRAGCGLCDEMLHAIEAAGLAREYELRLVDVDADRALQDRYGWRVPVLEIAGEETFEGALETRAFARRFRSLAAVYRGDVLRGVDGS